MTRPDLGALAPVLSAKDCVFDDTGALREAAFRANVDPDLARSLHGHEAWATVRAIRMPARIKDRWGRAPALEALAFANPAVVGLERATMLRTPALRALLASTHRPRVLGMAWLGDMWPVLDEVLAMEPAPVELEIDNPNYDGEGFEGSRERWDRFWSSSFVAGLERLVMRFVNVRRAHWEALRDRGIPRAVFTLGSAQLVWTASPPTLHVPAITLPRAKAARAQAEHHLLYLEQELRALPDGIELVREET